MRNKKLEARLLYVKQNLWEELNKLRSANPVDLKAFAKITSKLDFIENVLFKLRIELSKVSKSS